MKIKAANALNLTDIKALDWTCYANSVRYATFVISPQRIHRQRGENLQLKVRQVREQ